MVYHLYHISYIISLCVCVCVCTMRARSCTPWLPYRQSFWRIQKSLCLHIVGSMQVWNLATDTPEQFVIEQPMATIQADGMSIHEDLLVYANLGTSTAVLCDLSQRGAVIESLRVPADDIWLSDSAATSSHVVVACRGRSGSTRIFAWDRSTKERILEIENASDISSIDLLGDCLLYHSWKGPLVICSVSSGDVLQTVPMPESSADATRLRLTRFRGSRSRIVFAQTAVDQGQCVFQSYALEETRPGVWHMRIIPFEANPDGWECTYTDSAIVCYDGPHLQVIDTSTLERVNLELPNEQEIQHLATYGMRMLVHCMPGATDEDSVRASRGIEQARHMIILYRPA